jgi:hypothetical protein
MDPEKRSGIILIIVGLLIPLAILPFVSGFSKEKGFFENFYNVGIEITKVSQENVPSEPAVKRDESTGKARITWSYFIPNRIPLRFILVFTVIFIYMGIIRIDRARRKNSDR